jgi:hypothetical protein
MNYLCLADFRQLTEAQILNQPAEQEFSREPGIPSIVVL